MFSLKTLHVKFRRFLPALLATAACLLAVELAFRHWQWQYDYDGWESPGLMKKMHDAEAQFAEDLLGGGVAGLSTADMRAYLEHVADRRMQRLGLEPIYGSRNPLAFMELQDVQELSNFFERRVSAYQVGVTGTVSFDDDF